MPCFTENSADCHFCVEAALTLISIHLRGAYNEGNYENYIEGNQS